MQRALGIEACTPEDVPEEDQELPACSLPHETRVAGDITLGGLLENLALQMGHKLAAMGDIRHGTEYSNR